MTASTPTAARILLLTGSAAAILMISAGILFLLTGRLISQFTHFQLFIGEIDGFSVALLFGGLAALLKAFEIRMRATATDDPSLTD